MFQALRDPLNMMLQMPSMHMDMGFPRMHFPKFPKLSATDFAGGSARMETSEFHCVNEVCSGKAVKGSWRMPLHKVAAK